MHFSGDNASVMFLLFLYCFFDGSCIAERTVVCLGIDQGSDRLHSALYFEVISFMFDLLQMTSPGIHLLNTEY